MVEKIKRLLQSTDLPKRERLEPEPPGPFHPLTTHELGTDTRRTLTDAEYLARFANEKELAEFRKAVEKQRASEPKEAWGKCSKCGNVVRMAWPFKPGPCMYCNRQAFKDGGMYHEASKAEVEAYHKEKRERNARMAEEQRRTRAARAVEAGQSRLR